MDFSFLRVYPPSHQICLKREGYDLEIIFGIFAEGKNLWIFACCRLIENAFLLGYEVWGGWGDKLIANEFAPFFCI